MASWLWASGETVYYGEKQQADQTWSPVAVNEAWRSASYNPFQGPTSDVRSPSWLHLLKAPHCLLHHRQDSAFDTLIFGIILDTNYSNQNKFFFS
jgi:hypothetical protein